PAAASGAGPGARAHGAVSPITSLRSARATRSARARRAAKLHGVGSRPGAAAAMIHRFRFAQTPNAAPIAAHPGRHHRLLTRLAGRRFALWCLAALLMACSVVLNSARAEDEFLDPEDAFRFSAAMSAADTLDLHYVVAPEYYMYRERFELHAPEGVIADAAYPRGFVKYDPTFERDMEVYYGQVTVRVRLARAGTEGLPASGSPVTLAIVSQGCADAGLCYPPETRELQITQAADGGWSV